MQRSDVLGASGAQTALTGRTLEACLGYLPSVVVLLWALHSSLAVKSVFHWARRGKGKHLPQCGAASGVVGSCGVTRGVLGGGLKEGCSWQLGPPVPSAHVLQGSGSSPPPARTSGAAPDELAGSVWSAACQMWTDKSCGLCCSLALGPRAKNKWVIIRKGCWQLRQLQQK